MRYTRKSFKMINNIKEKSDEVDRLKKSVIEQLEQQKKLKSEYEFKIAEIETKKELKKEKNVIIVYI